MSQLHSNYHTCFSTVSQVTTSHLSQRMWIDASLSSSGRRSLGKTCINYICIIFLCWAILCNFNSGPAVWGRSEVKICPLYRFFGHIPFFFNLFIFSLLSAHLSILQSLCIGFPSSIVRITHFLSSLQSGLQVPRPECGLCSLLQDISSRSQ